MAPASTQPLIRAQIIRFWIQHTERCSAKMVCGGLTMKFTINQKIIQCAYFRVYFTQIKFLKEVRSQVTYYTAMCHFVIPEPNSKSWHPHQDRREDSRKIKLFSTMPNTLDCYHLKDQHHWKSQFDKMMMILL